MIFMNTIYIIFGIKILNQNPDCHFGRQHGVQKKTLFLHQHVPWIMPDQ